MGLTQGTTDKTQLRSYRLQHTTTDVYVVVADACISNCEPPRAQTRAPFRFSGKSMHNGQSLYIVASLTLYIDVYRSVPSDAFQVFFPPD